MVMDTTWQNVVVTPIPTDIDPASVVRVLHDHSFLITLSPIVTRHEERERTPEGWIKYRVFEIVDLLPLGVWKRETNFSLHFRDKAEGVASFIHAKMGIVSDADYTVRPAEGDESPGWWIHERISSTCNVLLRHVVEGNMLPVRRKLHQNVIDEARKRQYHEAGAESGDAPLKSDDDRREDICTWDKQY